MLLKQNVSKADVFAVIIFALVMVSCGLFVGLGI
jgi:hypothetical protein